MFQTTVCVLRSNMLTHVRLIHLNQRRYECSVCQKAAFGTPSKLANHLRKVHRQSDLSEVEMLKKKFSQVCAHLQTYFCSSLSSLSTAFCLLNCHLFQAFCLDIFKAKNPKTQELKTKNSRIFPIKTQNTGKFLPF